LSVAYDRSVAFFNCQCMLDASTDWSVETLGVALHDIICKEKK
jgi:hypothetical protein